MIIANPIYDVVFKKLMEDERIAKFFIGTLLNEIVEEVQVKPQEFTYEGELAAIDNPAVQSAVERRIIERLSISVYRVDFIATIRTETGEYKKVLIEIQKAKNPIDVIRFRNYLGEHYRRQDEINTANGKQKVALPIVTIYLLGFSLSGIESAAVKVNRAYIDLLTQEVIQQKSDFIEKLTHDSYVVQMPRIQAKFQTRLEKLLSVFEQNYFVDEQGIIKEYHHAIDDESIKNMIEILHHAGTDPQQKKKIEAEQEAYRVLDLAVREKTEELKGLIQEKDKALEEKDKALEEQRRILEEKDRLIAALLKKQNEH